jgi:hypothetical protein
MNQHTEDVEAFFVLTATLESMEKTLSGFDTKCPKSVLKQMRDQYLKLVGGSLSLLCEPQRNLASSLISDCKAELYSLTAAVSNAVAVLGAVSNAGKFAVQERLTSMAADAALGKGENVFKEEVRADMAGGVYL